MGTRVEGRGHLAEVRAVDPLGLNGQARREDLDEGLILVEVLVELVNFLVGEVSVAGSVDGDLDTADLGQEVRLEVDVLPGLGLHQILAGDVGNVLLDLGRVAVAAAEGGSAEVVLRLSGELVEGGPAPV